MSGGRRPGGRSDIDPALNFLIERRVRSKLTQLQVAKRLNVSQAVVSSWENGRVDPTSVSGSAVRPSACHEVTGEIT